jgi:hypothetical protein
MFSEENKADKKKKRRRALLFEVRRFQAQDQRNLSPDFAVLLKERRRQT